MKKSKRLDIGDRVKMILDGKITGRQEPIPEDTRMILAGAIAFHLHDYAGDEMEPLVRAIVDYRDAYYKAQRCPDMILSSGKTEESAELMRNLESASERLFNLI